MAYILYKGKQSGGGDEHGSNVVFLASGKQDVGSTNVIDSSRTGAPFETTVQLTNSVQLFSRQTIQCDGGACLRTNSLANLNLYQKDFTIEGWVRFSSWNTNDNYVFCLAKNASLADFAFELTLRVISTSKLFRFSFYQGGAYKFDANTTLTASLNTWYFYQITYTHSTQTYRLYIDGVLLQTQVSEAISSNTNWAVMFGGVWVGAFSTYTVLGNLADCRVTRDVIRSATVPTARFPIPDW